MTAVTTDLTTPATAPTAPSRDGSAVVARGDVEAVLGALADAAACHERHRGRPAVAAAYRRISRALGGSPLTTPAADPPGAAEAAQSGPAAVAVASVATISGDERIRLLTRLCATDPEVVNRGLAWLAGEHAASVERERIRRNRRATLRSRRRRARRAAVS